MVRGLAAPAARWDASWYLVIAHYGYRPDLGSFTSSRTAFFPLYPLGLHAIATSGVPPVLAGSFLLDAFSPENALPEPACLHPIRLLS